MKKYLIIVFIIFLGCATPPEVKQLSTKQIEYFDSLINAVTLQTDALILASENLATQAKIRIDSDHLKNIQDSKNSIISNNLDEEAAKKIISELSGSVLNSAQAKNNLDQDILIIKEKSNELLVYLNKMKELQMAINLYIQSEKAGETLTSGVLNQPSIEYFLESINELRPKIQNNLNGIIYILDNNL